MKRSPLIRRTPLARVGRKRKANAAEWWQARRWCLDRAQGRCEVCGNRATEAHHILRRSQGGTNDPSNLLAVCYACHARIHVQPQWAFERGYLCSRYGRRCA